MKSYYTRFSHLIGDPFIIFIISCSVLFLLPWVVALEEREEKSSLAVEISKDEALRAIKLYFVAESAVRDRNAYVLELFVRYKVSDKTHQLDVGSGKFVPLSLSLTSTPPVVEEAPETKIKK